MDCKNEMSVRHYSLMLSDTEIAILDILAEIIFHAFYKKNKETGSHER
jgi:hypothetical protein